MYIAFGLLSLSYKYYGKQCLHLSTRIHGEVPDDWRFWFGSVWDWVVLVPSEFDPPYFVAWLLTPKIWLFCLYCLLTTEFHFFNVFFVGMSGNFVALVSWGLAAMTANILIDTLDCGLMGGVDTFVSQLFGRKDFYSWSLYLNISRYLLLLAIPQLIVFYFAEQILVQLDQPEEIAFQTCQFLLIVFPGYIALVQFKTVRHYLNWWNIFNPILVIAGITLIIQVLGLYILVITLEYGIVGVGINTSIS